MTSIEANSRRPRVVKTALSQHNYAANPSKKGRVQQSLTLRERRLSASGHLEMAARKLSSIRLSMWARARASRWLRHRFQAWKAPILAVCFRNRRATVCNSLAVRYLEVGAQMSSKKAIPNSLESNF